MAYVVHIVLNWVLRSTLNDNSGLLSGNLCLFLFFCNFNLGGYAIVYSQTYFLLTFVLTCVKVEVTLYTTCCEILNIFARHVESANEAAVSSYRQDFSNHSNELIDVVSSHVDDQKYFCSKQSSGIEESCDRRSKEMSEVTNTYTEAVTKLIEVS